MNNLDLIKIATDHINEQYAEGKHHVATALKTKSQIYLAVHLDTKGFDVCAEPIAISNSLAAKDTEYEAIVAVVKNKDQSTRVISPCGNCRQILLEYAPEINVIVGSEDKYITLKPGELLPNPY